MATVELYEKVGEITIAELRPASINRSIAQSENDRKKEEERIRKEREEAEKRQRASVILAKLIEAINEQADLGKFGLHLNWTTSNYDELLISDSDWLKCDHAANVDPILEAAGYHVNTYWYSDSWTRRSGKIGYLHISWCE